MADPKPRIPSAFDTDFVPEVKLGRQIQFKLPQIKDQSRFFRDNIANEQKGKQFRLNKTQI